MKTMTRILSLIMTLILFTCMLPATANAAAA